MNIDYKNIKNFYYGGGSGKPNNFGDCVNKVFFTELLNVNDLKFEKNNTTYHYITTGSIFTHVNKYSIVWGTGCISENCEIGGNNFKSNSNKVIQKPNKIFSVRGPRTRNKLLQMGIECPENYGDPLLLFPILYNNFEIKTTIKYGIIPHYADAKTETLSNLVNNLNLSQTGNTKIINIIMIDSEYKKFIDQILSCEYIISSSLHGVMMGIIYRKKTIFVEFSNSVIGNKFKFFDFFESIGISYDVKNIHDITILNNVIKVDYDLVKKRIENMIESCPFIYDKQNLLNKYYEFEKKIL